jgi:hypothetical protein
MEEEKCLIPVCYIPGAVDGHRNDDDSWDFRH